MSVETELRTLIERIVEEKLEQRLAHAKAGEEYMSTSAAATFADVAPGTIRRWIREGKLPEHRAGRVVRVRRSDLERLLKNGRRQVDDSPEVLARRAFGS